MGNVTGDDSRDNYKVNRKDGKMANFCTRCGRPLHEGETCACQLSEKKTMENTQSASGQQTVKDPQADSWKLGREPQQSQLERQVTAFAQEGFKNFLEIMKDPVNVGKKMIMEADAKTALLIMALQGIFSAVFIMIAEGSLMAEFEISAPFGRIFMVTWLMSVGLACALALFLKVGNAILKIPISFAQVLPAVSVRSAALAPAIILSVIVSVIHMGAGIVLFIMVNIWGFAAMIVTLSSLTEQEKLNKFALMVSIAILLFILLAVFVLTKTIRFYIPDEILTFISNIEDLGDILSFL